ncbi:MAG: STAS domain-containing protein [Candidatus Hydrogenedentes bacterium]|jgi:anti-sigma B factor antagonist|nr:STAS domain-containing protein [Candidatus Hydrogenedentota bacterium]
MIGIEHFEKNGVTVLRLNGEIEGTVNQLLRDAISACVRNNQYHLVLNLSAVTFVSSEGIGTIVEYLGHFRMNKGDIKLVGLNLQSRRLLDLMGLSRVFAICKFESVAMKEYSKVAA